MPYADLSDIRMHYDTAGDEGTPVLLIMGFGVPGRLWANQVRDLEPHHQVAWFDNSGAGASASQGLGRRRRRPFSIPDMARHASELIAHLGWREAHVVGVSMGGMIAQEMGLRHRHRVRSLSLLVTHAGGPRNILPPVRTLDLFLRGFLGPKDNRAHALQQLVYPQEYLQTIDAGHLKRFLKDEVAQGASDRGKLGQVTAVLRHNTGRRLQKLAGVPTLVVRAGKDRLIRPEEHERLHRLIPGSRLVSFEDAGHAIMHQCADRLNAALLDHFRGVDDR